MNGWRNDNAHERIWLSPPHVTDGDRVALVDVLDSNWVAPVGPHLDSFERAFSRIVGVEHAVALASGTAALHLALLILGITSGDEVLVSDLTFAASANAVRYVGAAPVFIDADPTTWNLDPHLVIDELEDRARRGRLPSALIAVDLYGQVADFALLRDACRSFDIPIIEDAAEALGATYMENPAGSFGDIAIFSFNGNKIITTSGGGMLVSSNHKWVQRAHYLATQAREPYAYYEHIEVGYNYRMSNVLAALGCSQLTHLAERVARKRSIRASYEAALGGYTGLTFIPYPKNAEPSWWLTCMAIDPSSSGSSRDELIRQLSINNIESRPVWKPMHLQPVYREASVVGGTVAEGIFKNGICLPSGSSLSDSDLERVIGVICAELR